MFGFRMSNPFLVWRNEAHIEALGLKVWKFTWCLTLRSSEDGESRWVHLRLSASTFFGQNPHTSRWSWGPLQFNPHSGGVTLFSQTLYDPANGDVEVDW